MTNKSGLPISPGDVTCMAVHKRLEPQLSFEEFAAKANSPPDDRKNMKEDVQKAAQALEEEHSGDRVLPTFIPGANAFEHSEFGHTIYVKGGLLSEAELVTHTGKSGKDLGLNPYSLAYEHGQATNYYAISLAGLSADERDSIRKIKFYHSSTVVNDKMWVTPGTQLTKWHGKSMMEHMSQKYGKTKPSVATLPTLGSLQDLAARVEASRKDLLQKDATGGDDALAEPVGPVIERNAMLDGFEEEDGHGSKKGGKSRKKQAKPPSEIDSRRSTTTGESDGGPMVSMKAILAPDSSCAAAAPEASPPSEVASSRKSTQKGSAWEEMGMDSEMIKVATLHVGERPRNHSAKCLVGLVVSKFMAESTDHVKGHSLPNATCQHCDTWYLVPGLQYGVRCSVV